MAAGPTAAVRDGIGGGEDGPPRPLVGTRARTGRAPAPKAGVVLNPETIGTEGRWGKEFKGLKVTTFRTLTHIPGQAPSKDYSPFMWS